MKKQKPAHPLRPLRTDRDHAGAVHEIKQLWAVKPGTPDRDPLETLGPLVGAYEGRR